MQFFNQGEATPRLLEHSITSSGLVMNTLYLVRISSIVGPGICSIHCLRSWYVSSMMFVTLCGSASSSSSTTKRTHAVQTRTFYFSNNFLVPFSTLTTALKPSQKPMMERLSPCKLSYWQLSLKSHRKLQTQSDLISKAHCSNWRGGAGKLICRF